MRACLRACVMTEPLARETDSSWDLKRYARGRPWSWQICFELTSHVSLWFCIAADEVLGKMKFI